MVKMMVFCSTKQKYNTDLLLEILDSLLKTVSFLEIFLVEVRRDREDVGNTRPAGAAPRHQAGKCLGLGTAGPRLAGDSWGEPGLTKLQLLTVFRHS